MSVNIRVEVPGRCELLSSDRSEPSLQVHLSRANDWIGGDGDDGLRVTVCPFLPVDTLSKSECLKQSLKHYDCGFPLRA